MKQWEKGKYSIKLKKKLKRGNKTEIWPMHRIGFHSNRFVPKVCMKNELDIIDLNFFIYAYSLSSI